MPLKRLRFCFVATFYPPHSFGGDGIFVHRLANELAERGHEVEVVHCIDAYRTLSKPAPGEACRNHPNVKVHGLRSPLGLLSPLLTHQTGLPLLKRRALRRILSRDFDVIHYHNISLVGGPRILFYGRAVKLFTMHEYWLVCPTHSLFKFNRRPCSRRHCLPCSLVHGRPPQLWRWCRPFLRSSVGQVDAFIALSRFIKAKHQEYFPDLPIVELPPFAPVARRESSLDAPADPHLPGERYFLYVGRLEKLKGVHTLIPFFRRNPAIPLWIAGAGGFETRLREMAPGANVRFLGHIPEPALRDLYRGAIALIVPSICYEVSPLVILEAFRESTPVIARRIGGLPEPVEDSGGGIVYGTDDELAAALGKLSADPGYRRELGELGYRAFRERWTAAAHIDRYLDLIDRLAAGMAGPSAATGAE